MYWPSQNAYNDAVQNPSAYFYDTELKSGAILLDHQGLPKVSSGGFACVYQLTTAEGRKWAVRCFINHYEDSQERYSALSDYLTKLGLPFIADFTYQPKGIWVRDKWYPILKMEWIEGLCLDQYIKQKLNGDSEGLHDLAQNWLNMISILREAQIAHCDLHHANVMISSSNTLKLVDYDDLFIPSFAGKISRSNGLPAYQHPERRHEDYYDGTDQFSALVIYLSILAMIEDPAIIQRYNAFQDENLLFRQADYLAPDKSDLFKELLNSRESNIRELAAALQQACFADIRAVPNVLKLVDTSGLSNRVRSFSYQLKWRRPDYRNKVVMVDEPIYGMREKEVNQTPWTRILTKMGAKAKTPSEKEHVQIGTHQVAVNKSELTPGQEDGVTSLAFSSNSEFLFAGSSKGTIYKWEVGSGDVLDKLQTSSWACWEIESIYVAEDNSLKCSSHNSRAEITIDSEGNISSNNKALGLLSPNGDYAAWRDDAGLVHLENIKGKGPTKRITSIPNVDAMAFSFDSKILVALSSKGSLSIWDTIKRKRVGQAKKAPAGIFIAIHPNNNTLALATKLGEIIIWDILQHSQVGSIAKTEGRTDCAAFSHSGRLLACGTHDGNISIYSIDMPVPADDQARQAEVEPKITKSTDKSDIPPQASDSNVTKLPQTNIVGQGRAEQFTTPTGFKVLKLEDLQHE